MKNLKKLIYILSSINFLISQDEIAPNLNGTELFNYIQNNYSTTNVESYNSARDILYSEIDNTNGYVKCVYTDYSVQLNNSDPSTHLYENGINCEHLWPQSLGASSSPMKSDMHHLRPCKDNVNSARGNKPFNDIDDWLTETWYRLDYELNSMPSSNINEFSENGTNYFEPKENVKGDIARAIFYFFTIYNDVADHGFFESQKEILYQWHNEDPINNLEINRTWNIASYQNNIPNPFIIDETLVFRTFFYEENSDNVGDITQDGIINIVDIILMVNFILELQDLNNEQFLSADGNEDGIINIIDILIVLNIILEN